jgi:hypothetical protein
MAAERFREWYAHANWDTVEALQAHAEKRGITLLDVAIGGLAAKPGVTSVIAGATSPRAGGRECGGGALGADPGGPRRTRRYVRRRTGAGTLAPQSLVRLGIVQLLSVSAKWAIISPIHASSSIHDAAEWVRKPNRTVTRRMVRHRPPSTTQ